MAEAMGGGSAFALLALGELLTRGEVIGDDVVFVFDQSAIDSALAKVSGAPHPQPELLAEIVWSNCAKIALAYGNICDCCGRANDMDWDHERKAFVIAGHGPCIRSQASPGEKE